MTNHKDPTSFHEDTEDAFHRRVLPDSPDRCQAVAAQGDQCRFAKIEPSPYCKMHGGATALKDRKADAIRQYHIAKHRARMDYFSSHEAIFNLRDDIGVLRLLVETTLNQLSEPSQIFQHAPRVAHLVKEVRETIKEAKRLESSLGELLDKGAVLRISDQIIQIISSEIDDPEVLGRIADRIAVAIGEVVSQVKNQDQ